MGSYQCKVVLGGEGLRRQIVALRHEGLKTEPAFARRLDLEGDPYVVLLALEGWDDKALGTLLDDTADPDGGQAG